jgi:hypothetical protein
MRSDGSPLCGIASAGNSAGEVGAVTPAVTPGRRGVTPVTTVTPSAEESAKGKVRKLFDECQTSAAEKWNAPRERPFRCLI